jgi:hypothetical protein
MWLEDGVNFSGMEKTQARLEKPEAMKRLSKPVLKSGRPAGLLNLIPRPIAKEIARAAAECRPGGFGEFLIEMSRSEVASDRATFAGCVLRLLPPVQTQAGGPAVTINLGWLTGRAVAGSAHTVTIDQPAPEAEAHNADV